MYLVRVKAAIVDALQAVYDSASVPEELRGMRVSLDYPMAKQHYPSIWVNYDDTDSLRIVGIDYREYVWDHPSPDNPALPDPAWDPADGPNEQHVVTRWSFAGEVTLTFVAINSSMERDRIYDEFVRVFAFSRVEEAQTDFRSIIETNDFVGMFINWDELRPHGDGAAPGTPWGTEDEVIYEKSVGFELQGEFISDPSTNELLRLSSIQVTGFRESPEIDDDPFMLGLS